MFDLPDLRVKTPALTFDMPFMFLIDIDTDESRVKFISQALQHRTSLKISRDQIIIKANDYYEKFINLNL